MKANGKSLIHSPSTIKSKGRDNMIKFVFHPKLLLMLTVLSFILAGIASVFCPLDIPLHFNGGSQADVFVNKYIGLFLFPVLMLLLLIMNRFYYHAAGAIYFIAFLHIFVLYNALTYAR